jgi:tetratricopeptide (TPR) repeat protein
MTPELVRDLLAVGCPVRAAEVMLSSSLPRTRSLVQSLGRGEWSLPVPATSSVRNALRARIGREPQALSPQRGVYALSIRRVSGEDLGLVERLVPTMVPSAANDEFTRGAAAGEHRARDWLARVVGPIKDLATGFFLLEKIQPLPGSSQPADLRGDSAGLAAALATVWRLWSEVDFIAATGRVDSDGRVHPVDFIEAKLEGLHREAPFIRRVLVPWSKTYCERSTRDHLEIIPIRTVDEALELVFGSRHVRLSLMPPLDAAREAIRLELAREYAFATAYASAALRGLDDSALSQRERALGEALSTAVNAINLTHRGQAKLAEQAFRQIEQALSSALRANPRAQIAAMRTSALIDLLDFDGAIAVCERCADIVDDVDPLPEVVLRGSWARALSAASRLEEAQVQAREQCSITGLDLTNQHQLVQAYCNLIEIELKLHYSGDTEAITRASIAHNHGMRTNTDASQPARDRNRMFLAYWEVRILCAKDHLDVASHHIEDLPKGGYPNHLLLRYLADAYLRRGDKNAALELSMQARRSVSCDANDFERIILLSSTPMESRLRMQCSLPDIREPALEFASLLDAWKPGFIRWPNDDTADDEAWVNALENAVSRLPY